MFNKNNIAAGLLAGFIPPVIAWLVFEYLLHNNALIMNKPGVQYLIAVGLNLLLLRYTIKNHLGETAKGIMIVTFAVMIAAFIFRVH
jgi:hypothetical protein